ncbi:ferritin-like domain-containing protein [Roseiconus lacunae]|uniref:ferritin-like domain-containing protein n=1 Tax=Roseiconus lacunae TaxID=2605694 RepID=UPI001E2C921A|nr:ferritin-like protein [Roseiconus lacunae]MCD0460686.1 ferritin-like protein [Roseiconus lacunae]
MSDKRITELAQSNIDDCDIQWLKQALQSAIELEFFTIPPYLTALWSVKGRRDPVAIAIREVLVEEMLHMSLACNMLASIGGTPRIFDPEIVPSYPSAMPGGVKPLLTVSLQGLSKEALGVFMKIEEPETDIAHLETVRKTESYARIGEFYDKIKLVFDNLEPEFTREGQIEAYFGESQLPHGKYIPKNIGSIEDVEAAIDLIKDQGEGTSESVKDDDTDELAHYYRFKEVAVGRKLIQDDDGRWVHQGPVVQMPDCWPVAEIPPGGYQQDDVPPETWARMVAFDLSYTRMLKQLGLAWSTGSHAALNQAIEAMMSDLPRLALEIMQVPIREQPFNYGPCFRFVDQEAD